LCAGLQLLQRLAPPTLKDLHTAIQRIKTSDAYKHTDTRKIGGLERRSSTPCALGLRPHSSPPAEWTKHALTSPSRPTDGGPESPTAQGGTRLARLALSAGPRARPPAAAGVCLKSLVDHITKGGLLGQGACHIHVLAHGYQPTSGVAALLQVMRGALQRCTAHVQLHCLAQQRTPPGRLPSPAGATARPRSRYACAGD
jgi:hypothetical protein